MKNLIIIIIGILILFINPTIVIAGRTISNLPNYKYTALGDSIATGFGAKESYVHIYTRYLKNDLPANISLSNLSKNGLTSTDLYNLIKNNNAVRRSISISQIVTFNIGSNDFLNARDAYKAGICGGVDNQDCLRMVLATFKVNWTNIVMEIQSLRSPQNTVIRTINLYNSKVNEDMPDDFLVFKLYLDQANDHIANSGVNFADVYTAFNGPNHNIDPADLGLLQKDDAHPNDAGQLLIADLLRALGYVPLK